MGSNLRVTLHHLLRRYQSPEYGVSKHLRILCGISFFEHFPNRIDIKATGSHHGNKSSLGTALVNQLVLTSYPTGIMTTHDLLSFIESHDFWLKISTFLRGSSLAQLESLTKYNGLVKMLVLPKDDFFYEIANKASSSCPYPGTHKLEK